MNALRSRYMLSFPYVRKNQNTPPFIEEPRKLLMSIEITSIKFQPY